VKNLQVWIEYLQKGLGTVETGMQRLDQGMRNAGRAAEEWDRKLQQVDQTLGRLQRTTAIVAGAGWAGLGLLVTKGIQAIDEVNSLYDNTQTLLKNAEATQELIQRIIRLSVKTPFEPTELQDAATSVLGYDKALKDLIATGNSGAMEQLLERLTVYGDIAAAKESTGVGIMEVINALEKLRVTGQWETEQLARVGLTLPMVSDVLGLDSQGRLLGTPQQKWEAGMVALEEMFGGGMEKLAKRIRGKLSTLRGNITLAFAELGDELVDGVGRVLDWMNEKLAAALNKGSPLNRAIRGIGQLINEEFGPWIDRALEKGEQLIDLLERDPQVLVNAMRTFISILKDLTAAVIVLTGARALLGLLMILAQLGAILLGGGIGGLVFAVAGTIGLIALFRQLRGAMDNVGSILPGLSSGLGETAAQAGAADSATAGFDSTLGSLSQTLGPLPDQLAVLWEQLSKIANIEIGDTEFWDYLLTGGKDIDLNRFVGVTGAFGGEKLRLDSGDDVSFFGLISMIGSGGRPQYQGQPVSPYGQYGIDFFTALGQQLTQEQAIEGGPDTRVFGPYSTPAEYAAAGQTAEQARQRWVESLNDPQAWADARQQGEDAVEAVTGATTNTCVGTVASFLRGMGAQVPEGTVNTRQLVDWIEGQGGVRVQATDWASWGDVLKPGDFLFTGQPTLEDSPAGHAQVVADVVPTDGPFGAEIYVTDNQGRRRRWQPLGDAAQGAFAYTMPTSFWAGLGAAAPAAPTGDSWALPGDDGATAEGNQRRQWLEQLAAAQQREALARAELADAIEAEEAQRREAAERDLEDAKRHLRISEARAEGREGYATALAGEQKVEDLSRSLEDLRNAGDVSAAQLHTLEVAAYAAAAALLDFATQYKELAPELAAALEEEYARAMANLAQLTGGDASQYMPERDAEGYALRFDDGKLTPAGEQWLEGIGGAAALDECGPGG